MDTMSRLLRSTKGQYMNITIRKGMIVAMALGISLFGGACTTATPASDPAASQPCLVDSTKAPTLSTLRPISDDEPLAKALSSCEFDSTKQLADATLSLKWTGEKPVQMWLEVIDNGKQIPLSQVQGIVFTADVNNEFGGGQPGTSVPAASREHPADVWTQGYPLSLNDDVLLYGKYDDSSNSIKLKSWHLKDIAERI